MAHTKGPWQVKDDGYSIVGDNKRRLVAEIMTVASQTREDNAHLIAAAPNLLEACKLVLHLIKNHQAYDKDAQSILEQAIARAKGEVSND